MISNGVNDKHRGRKLSFLFVSYNILVLILLGLTVYILVPILYNVITTKEYKTGGKEDEEGKDDELDRDDSLRNDSRRSHF
jgi:hypothetical protein